MSSHLKIIGTMAGTVVGWVLTQSMTLCLPIVFRVVDESSKQPVAGALVFALWKSYTVTLAGANPGESLIARAGRSDANGWVHLPMGFVIHSPMAPFGWRARDWNHFPQLLIVDSQHALKFERSDWFWPYPTVLFGSPPIAPSVHLGGTIALEAPEPMVTGHDGSRLGLINDELAFTGLKLSQRDRCDFLAPARWYLVTTYAHTFPNQSWRDGEFNRMLAPCR